MAPPSSNKGGQSKYQVNTATRVLHTGHHKILCVADIRGKLSLLNSMAKDVNAAAVIHTGDFGFYDADSLPRVTDRTLRHLAQYSPLLSPAKRTSVLDPSADAGTLRSELTIDAISEFPLLAEGQFSLDIPVYTVWGACEDVQILEKIRGGEITIPNLEILDEATTRLIDVGGIKLRLFGLGGALVPHKMLDNGDGNATIAGGGGTMWATLLQIGELVDTAQRVYDPTETRMLITHASPGREGIIAQLALVVKADLTVSAGLHFRYSTSHNEFSTQPDFEGYRRKIAVGKESFDKVWTSVKAQVDNVIDEHQSVLLNKALSVVEKMPTGQGNAGPGSTTATDDSAWKNCWNWNLCDAAYGHLVLDINEGRVSAELKSQGFNYAYRRTAQVSPTVGAAAAGTPKAATPKPPVSGKATPAPTAATPAAGKVTPAPATSGKATPAPASSTTSPAPDGATSPASNTSGPQSKAEKEKAKKAAKKEKKAAAAEEQKTADSEEAGKSPVVTSPTELKSPASGASTPKTNKPPRNPWTIFMRMKDNGATEEQVREYFGDASKDIAKITYPATFAGRAQKVCFIEFPDEDSMKKALELGKDPKELNGGIPEMKQADMDRPKGGSDGDRGRGRGRGGRGGFASRALGAAGLRGRGRGGADSAPAE